MYSAQDWIDQLNLAAHPEGGYFAEVYRSAEKVAKSGLPPRFAGDRSLGTSIYFLLRGDRFSAFHRIKSDEGWHYYTGTHPVELLVISPGGELNTHWLGEDFERGERFQAVVPAEHWFAARVGSSEEDFALVGCTVSPGFDFADFELAERSKLQEIFPQHSDLIEEMTRTT
ncbi:MAG: cupin domain-containing protein [Bacteroidota bacterium]